MGKAGAGICAKASGVIGLTYEGESILILRRRRSFPRMQDG